MSITYPAGMPIPLISGYKQSDNNKIKSDDFKKGLANFDILTEDSFFEISANWLLSALEFQVFEGWFKHELTFGSKSFAMNVKVGSGLGLHDFYFDNGYKSSLVGKKWRVTAKLIGVSKIYDSLSDYNAAKLIVCPPNFSIGDYYWPLDDVSGDAVAAVGGFDLTKLDPFSIMQFQQPSLRADLGGGSVFYDEGSHHIHTDMPIPYANGLTIEYLIKPMKTEFRGVAGTSSGGVNAVSGNPQESLWILRFDNFDDINQTGVVPVFALIEREGTHNPQGYPSNTRVEIRGVEQIVFGDTYHFLATVRPNSNTIEFWLNGVSIGSAAIPDPDTWYYSNLGQGAAKDILAGNFAWTADVGVGLVGGSWRDNESFIQDVRIHLLEADQAFATQQYNFAMGV